MLTLLCVPFNVRGNGVQGFANARFSLFGQSSILSPHTGERYFTHPMFSQIKKEAEEMKKQPLPEPFDNTQFGFATPRG